MERRYTEGFKARMIERMSGPHAISALALARETGLAQTTLSRWLKAAPRLQAMATKDATPAAPTTWTPEQKLTAVLEAAALSGDALGAWLRRKGLHAEHLAQWRAAALAGLESGTRAAATAPPARRVRELERELRRKEKALAEAAALLVLRKKVEALWADGADDTDEGSAT